MDYEHISIIEYHRELAEAKCQKQMLDATVENMWRCFNCCVFRTNSGVTKLIHWFYQVALHRSDYTEEQVFAVLRCKQYRYLISSAKRPVKVLEALLLQERYKQHGQTREVRHI